jgi:esterase/lipase
MRRLLYFLIAIAVLVGIFMLFGPRPVHDETVRFDPASIGADPVAFLAAGEANFPAIRPGAEKEIIWIDPASKARTPLSVVYIHGFSATKEEIRPVPDDLAKALGANIFFARLTGHGQDGPAMATATMNSWINDMAEAMAIGTLIGERVIVVGTSTGATLATWAAAQPQFAEHMAALVFVSPNFAIQGASTGLLNMPWAEILLPMAMGQTRSFEPHNEGQAKWWTTSYPSRAVFPMGALLKVVSALHFEDIKVPMIIFQSRKDEVVVPEMSHQVHDRWGGPRQLVWVQESGDPSNHVLAGDILSPQNNALVVETTLTFLKEKAGLN